MLASQHIKSAANQAKVHCVMLIWQFHRIQKYF